jgi:hypothetical protein
MSTVMRAPRKCSQCRQEGCNKGKATCPVNIERTGGAGVVPVVVPVVVRPVKKRLCGACRREGCCATSILCPVKIEINRHYDRANRIEDYAPDNEHLYQEMLFSHIQDPIYRYRLSANLFYKIREIYRDQRFIFMMRIMAERRATGVYSNQQRSKVKLNVLPEYKMCSEECGICYDKTCNVTLNCNHQVCVDCFKSHVTATETKFNATLKCPFCRCVTETVNATDNIVYDELLKV